MLKRFVFIFPNPLIRFLHFLPQFYFQMNPVFLVVIKFLFQMFFFRANLFLNKLLHRLWARKGLF